MITLTGNGRLTRDPQLRTTHSGKTVATSVASERRDRTADAIYIDLIVAEAQAATAAAQHLVKSQAVSFAGRYEPREFVTQSGDQRVALELHGVDLEDGAKPRGRHTAPAAEGKDESTGAADEQDIPF